MVFEALTPSPSSDILTKIASSRDLSQDFACLVFLEEILRDRRFDSSFPDFVRFTEDGNIDEEKTFRLFLECWRSPGHVFGKDIILERGGSVDFQAWEKSGEYSLDLWFFEIFQHIAIVASNPQEVDTDVAREKFREIHMRKKHEFLEKSQEKWSAKKQVERSAAQVTKTIHP